MVKVAPFFDSVSQKGCHPIHGYDFVNSWSVCKILPLLEGAENSE